MDISFVIPCYCAEKNIEHVIKKIYSAMMIRPEVSFEIILVNDHSKDNTWEKIKEISRKHKEVIGVNLSKNFGQHNALMAGFKVTQGHLIMTSDDDGQTPVDRVWDFVKKIEEGCDVVCAKYIERKRKGLGRKVGSYLNEYMLCHILEKPEDVALASFFMAKRFVISEICRYEQAFPYMAGLLLRTTRNIGNIELVQESRESGSSGYNLKKLLKLWINGFTSFSVKPLRAFVKLGFCIAFLGLVIGLGTIIRKIVYSSYVLVGYTSVIAIMCILGGMNLAVVGIVGEYIGRMYMCINSQPQYVIKNYVKDGSEVNELQNTEKII